MSKKTCKIGDTKNFFCRNRALIISLLVIAASSLRVHMYIQNNNFGMGIFESRHRGALISQAEEVLGESLSGYDGWDGRGINHNFIMYEIQKGNDKLRLQGECIFTCELQKIGREVKGIRKIIYSNIDEDKLHITRDDERSIAHFGGDKIDIEKELKVKGEIEAKKEKKEKVKKDVFEEQKIYIKKDVSRIIGRRDSEYRDEFEIINYNDDKYEVNNIITVEIKHKSLSTEKGILEAKGGISNYEKYLVHAQCQKTCVVKKITIIKNNIEQVIYSIDKEDSEIELEKRKNKLQIK